MIKRQVLCINKIDRYSRWESITHLGGNWGANGEYVRYTQADVIKHIEGGLYSYYVRVGLTESKVIVGDHNGNKYLKTLADTTTIDNLLSLKECPK